MATLPRAVRGVLRVGAHARAQRAAAAAVGVTPRAASTVSAPASALGGGPHGGGGGGSSHGRGGGGGWQRGDAYLALAAAAGAGGLACGALGLDPRATRAYGAAADGVALPLLRLLPPESAHAAGIALAGAGLAPRPPPPASAAAAAAADAALRVRVAGLDFAHPVCLAAGFDKQGEAVEGLLAAGFAAVEVGTVVPLPQPGNPPPRMFRLPADGAVINRFGFNSDGANAVAGRLDAFWAAALRRGWRPGDTLAGTGAGGGGGGAGRPRGVVGVNVGKNKEGDAEADYAAATARLAPYADYLAVNVSSPNTPGLRALQKRDALAGVLAAVRAARDGLPWGQPERAGAPGAPGGVRARLLACRATPPPIFVKVSPDMSAADMDDVAAVAVAARVDALIVSNTTLARPATLRAPPGVAAEAGGLSGAPLRAPATAALAALAARLAGSGVALIGVGGVGDAASAREKLAAGASLVQLYTAAVYGGPGVAGRIADGLAAAVRDEGVASVADLVGRPPPPPAAARA